VAPAAAERIRGLVYNPLGVVHLHAETDLRGLGYQVGLDEDLATRGVTWNDSLFGREGVYTAYLGGAKNPAVVTEPDDRLGQLAADEFRRVTGWEARVLAVDRERMPAWDVSWRALEGLQLPPGIRIAANWMSRPGIPGRLAEARRLAERLG
jgi:oxygen-dependent protoporphyrinogen oxidase